MHEDRRVRSQQQFEDYVNSFVTEEELNSRLYLPDLKDLYSLYRSVRTSKSVSVLEYGSGWSTLVLALAINENLEADGPAYINKVRHPNPFKLMTVDVSRKFQDMAMSRIPADLQKVIIPVVSNCEIGTFRDQICSYFTEVPPFTADFIYLDGPDCDQVQGNVGGFNFDFGSESHRYGLPMSGDLLRLEFFFWPGTRIVVDGRGANASFLRSNFTRNWTYEFNKNLDQHFFVLSESAWGDISQRHLDATS